jgi:hypothetical protein
MPEESERLAQYRDIKRRLEVVQHELEGLVEPHPPEGAEVQCAFRRGQEQLMYVEKAIEKIERKA